MSPLPILGTLHVLAPRGTGSQPPTKPDAIALEGWAEGFSESPFLLSFFFFLCLGRLPSLLLWGRVSTRLRR